MSALPPKADIAKCYRHVRFVPKADSCTAAIGPPLLQVLTNFCQQLAWTERFRHIVITTSRSRLLLFTTERIRGDRDDRDRSQRWVGLDFASGCVAVDDRQLDVHQNQIGPLLCDSLQRLLPVFGLGDLIIGRGQHIADDLTIIRLVLHHQNALAHVGSTCRSTMTGSVKVNVEPSPGCDSTQIRPPCISIMRLEMASPKPVPPFLRVIALSAC